MGQLHERNGSLAYFARRDRFGLLSAKTGGGDGRQSVLPVFEKSRWNRTLAQNFRVVEFAGVSRRGNQ